MRDLDNKEVVDSSASLGDILRAALHQSKIRAAMSTPPHYFTKRCIDIDLTQKIERVKVYRREHECTLPQAKQSVETLILIELLDQAQTMEDITLIKEWAKYNLYDSLTRI